MIFEVALALTIAPDWTNGRTDRGLGAPCAPLLRIVQQPGACAAP